MSNIFNEDEQDQTFLTALLDENEKNVIENKPILISNEENEDDIDIEIKSSVSDTDDNDEVNSINEEHKANDITQDENEKLLELVQISEDYDKAEDANKIEPVNDYNTTIIPRSVYDYATTVHEMLESPRYSKLHHDVFMVLGSSDPPPGFGFLHPRFYYLEQKRPVPMHPLKVWRGYNGHVYFEPIKYTRLENERDIYSVNTNDAPFRLNKNSKRHSLAHDTRSRQQQTKRSYTTSSTRKPKTSAVLNSHKIIIDGPLSIIKGKSIISKPSSTTQYEQHRQQNIATQFSNHSLLNDPCIVADETVSITESPSKLNNNTLETFVQQELNENMWQSVKTCAPIQIKPISKRSKHLIEDMQHLQQEQNIQDPTGYYRQVLPNIKPIPKYKNIYKGLAYKEGKKIASNNSENDAPKPLVSYNLAQAYARFEINASKNKGQQKQQEQQQTPFNTPFKEQTPTATNYDIKEMRKRIVRGTTLAYRPPPVTGNWTPGRGGGGSESAASVSNVKVKGELITKAPMLNHVLFLQSSHMPVNMTTVDSNHKQVSLIDCTNITSPFTKTSRVQTHNIRSRTHYTTPNQSQQQSRIFSLTPNFVTLGQTMIVS